MINILNMHQCLEMEQIIRAIIDPSLIKSQEYPLDYTEEEMIIHKDCLR